MHNAFVDSILSVAVIQYFLSPILVAHGFFSVLISNLLFMVALSYYHYLNFLGYDVLPFSDLPKQSRDYLEKVLTDLKIYTTVGVKNDQNGLFLLEPKSNMQRIHGEFTLVASLEECKLCCSDSPSNLEICGECIHEKDLPAFFG